MGTKYWRQKLTENSGSLATPARQQSPKPYAAVVDLREEVYDGALRPFSETGIVVAHGAPNSEFWNPYRAHTLQSHVPPKPSSQLEIEDVSLERLMLFLRQDFLWRDEGHRLVTGPSDSPTGPTLP